MLNQLLLAILVIAVSATLVGTMQAEEKERLRMQVIGMFKHGFNSYMVRKLFRQTGDRLFHLRRSMRIPLMN